MSKMAQLNRAQQQTRVSPGNVDSSVHPCPGPPCEAAAFSVQCSHGRHLDVAYGEPNRDGRHVLQVISHPGAIDEVTVRARGSCTKGNDHCCPGIRVSGPETRISEKGPLRFHPLGGGRRERDLGFVEFLKHYLIPQDLEPNEYTVQSQRCSGPGRHKGTVQAFPAFSWDAGLGFGFKPTDAPEQAPPANSGFTRLKRRGSWTLNGNCKLGIGRQEWEFGASADKASQQDYFQGLKEAVDTLVPFLSHLGAEVGGKKNLVTFEPQWPNVTLQGGVKLEEIPDRPEVDLAGSIAIDMNPLIGATVETDILDWIIRTAPPPASAFLIKVKDAAEEGFKTQYFEGGVLIGIILRIQGEVKGKLEWTKAAGKEWQLAGSEGMGAVEADLGMSLAGKIRVKSKIFFVKIMLGTEVALKGAKEESDRVGITGRVLADSTDKYPSVSGSFVFTGATIYYTYYAEVGVKTIENEELSKELPGRKDAKTYANKGKMQMESAKREMTMKKLVELFRYRQWPRDKDEFGSLSLYRVMQ